MLLNPLFSKYSIIDPKTNSNVLLNHEVLLISIHQNDPTSHLVPAEWDHINRPLEAKITNHNKAILANSSRTNNDEINQCNCRNKSECPLDGYCLTNNVIYQATVVSDKSTETYIGLTENHFKTRYRNHLASFKDKNKKNATHSSRYIRTLNEKNIGYDLKWRILARANSYSNTNKRCNLCIAEKYFIICKPQLCSLNSRNELVNKCRHARKWCLSNI